MTQLQELINVYCDESCHLQFDKYKVMALGAIYCPTKIVKQISKDIQQIQFKYKLTRSFEIKWSKVSPSLQNFYNELVDYFFKEPSLSYRGIIIPDKEKLTHEQFEQTHDEFYYKMYYVLLRYIINPLKRYQFYVDIKDTKGGSKTCKLQKVLANSIYDFNEECVTKVQQIHSSESALLQLCDLFTGILTYENRHLSGNAGKLSLVKKVKSFLPSSTLTRSTPLHYNKFNLLVWDAQS